MGREITSADTRITSNRKLLKCFTRRGVGEGDISLPNDSDQATRMMVILSKID